MAATWSFPTHILFGEGAAGAVGEEAKRLGGSRALLVSDGGVQDAGATDLVREGLAAAGIEVEHCAAIRSSPKEAEVRAATQLSIESRADLIVAVGGGSVVDASKLVGLLSTQEIDLLSEEAPSLDDPIVQRPLPVIAVGTTAGTGSEVTAAAILTLESGRKTMLRSQHLMPQVAVLDPTLTATMPPELTAASGFDALSHCIESYCASGEHPMADAIALDGLKLAAKYLPKSICDSEDLAARGGMMKAAMMGGVAKQKGLGVCHALADALSVHMHHGRANALCLPAVLDFNRSVVPARIARVARLLNVRGDDEETLAFECSGALRALRKKTGLPDSIAELDVPESTLPDIAKTALKNPSHKTNPRPCTEEDILSMLRASF